MFWYFNINLIRNGGDGGRSGNGLGGIHDISNSHKQQHAKNVAAEGAQCNNILRFKSVVDSDEDGEALGVLLFLNSSSFAARR